MIRAFGNVSGITNQPPGLLVGLGSGNAQPSEVLTGKRFTNDRGQQTGTMPIYNTADSSNYVQVASGTPGAIYVRPSQGNWQSPGSIMIPDPDFVAAKIRKDVNLFGITGTHVGLPGEEWSVGALSGNWNTIVQVRRRLIVVGQSGRVAYSDDGGVNWTNVSGGPTADWSCATVIGTRVIVGSGTGAGGNQYYMYSDNLGASWTLGPSLATLNGGINELITIRNRVVAIGSGGMKAAYSDNMGASWTVVSSIPSNTNWYCATLLGNRILAGGNSSNGSSVMYSDNMGDSWILVAGPPSTIFSFGSVGNRVFTNDGNGTMYYSDDYGETWGSGSYPGTSYSRYVTVGRRLLCISTNRKVIYTDDLGASYTTTDYTLSTAASGFVFGGAVLVPGSNQIARSE
jgi:hypothetical protein